MVRDAAMGVYVKKTHSLCNNISKLSGKVLLCHRRGEEVCHADVLIKFHLVKLRHHVHIIEQCQQFLVRLQTSLSRNQRNQ